MAALGNMALRASRFRALQLPRAVSALRLKAGVGKAGVHRQGGLLKGKGAETKQGTQCKAARECIGGRRGRVSRRLANPREAIAFRQSRLHARRGNGTDVVGTVRARPRTAIQCNAWCVVVPGFVFIVFVATVLWLLVVGRKAYTSEVRKKLTMHSLIDRSACGRCAAVSVKLRALVFEPKVWHAEGAGKCRQCVACGGVRAKATEWVSAEVRCVK